MLHEGKFIFDGAMKELQGSKDPRVRCFVEGRCLEEDLASLSSTG
jgi:ABC-type transporter Mla maintaining outer membrane lipid asymmetry ATPase subunit MlaF